MSDNRRPRLELKIVNTVTGRGELRQYLSPPLASDATSMHDHASSIGKRVLPEGMVSAVQERIKGEPSLKPYSDASLTLYLHDNGFPEISSGDVAYARKLSGIGAPSQRKQS